MAATPAMTQSKTEPSGWVRLSPRKSNADADADRHPQIGLRCGADRTQRVDEPEIDHEGEGGRKDRQTEQSQDRMRRGRDRPGLVDDEADRNEQHRAAEERACCRHHRIEPLETSPEDRRAGIGDRRDDNRQLRERFLAQAIEALQGR